VEPDGDVAPRAAVNVAVAAPMPRLAPVGDGDAEVGFHQLIMLGLAVLLPGAGRPGLLASRPAVHK